MRTVGDISRYQALARPDAVAFEFEGRVTSYRALDDHVNRVANALLECGVGPGTHIAYLGKNSDLYFELLLGCAKAGAIVVPVNWRLTAAEIAFILHDVPVRILFVDAEFAPVVRSLGNAPACVRAMDGALWNQPDFIAWRDSHSPIDPGLSVQPEDVLLQLYTSGTTGKPKGAMLRHSGLIERYRLQDTLGESWYRWDPDDVSLVAMPIFHIGGTGWGLTGLYNGARGIVVREFSAAGVVALIERHRITRLFIVPAALQIVLQHPRLMAADLGSLRSVFYGASPIQPHVLGAALQVFRCNFVQMYGMTETSGAIVALAPGDHDLDDPERLSSAGRPLPGVELAILGPDGTTAAPLHTGEIAIRSICNMAGYWKQPGATAEVLGLDNWLRTGDLGYLDPQGYLFIRDRLKDMIVSGGENVYPAEVEHALAGHPDIAEVAVIAVPSQKWGEEVKAVVVPRPGTQLRESDLIAWARGRLAGYKVPKTVDFVESIPRNASAKILRRQLREPYWRGAGREVN